ncbi:unnamed protein product [Cuscuta europaea]|uniref:Uncharacterized protein n=1 Tax=Cuscuta europaea TaxID=41803 RepID=A0A9P0ZQ87_CUSEU|nr:unnamed protein product [Cuscuta europaea]
MAYHQRSINQSPPMDSQRYQSPTISFSTNEDNRVGYPDPEFGRSYGHFGSPMAAREAFLIEIEKESTREKIISDEIARARYAEARMEEEWALQRDGRLPPPEALFLGYDQRFPLLEQYPRDRSPIGQQSFMGTSGAGFATRHEHSQFEVSPFMERIAESRISEMSFMDRRVGSRISDPRHPYDSPRN